MGTPRWTSDDIGDLDGKVAIVTGSNSGIGLEDARELARHGATVVMAVRDVGRGEEAAEGIRTDAADAVVEVMKLDLAELTSIREFAATFSDRYSQLDLLVNNAGVMMPPASKTAGGFELQFGTNHLGHFALTGLLHGLLLDTPGSRVVNVSSQAHRWGRMEFDDLNWENRRYQEAASYGQSKLANLLFTFELQRRLDAAGVETVALSSHPGWTATNLQRNTGLFRALNPLFAMKPWQGALPTLFAATADEVEGGAYYGPKGFYEMRGYPGRVATSDRARDEAVARRLWAVSSELTGVDYDRLPAEG